MFSFVGVAQAAARCNGLVNAAGSVGGRVNQQMRVFVPRVALSHAAAEEVAPPVRPKRRKLKDPITLTDNAAERIKALLSGKPDALGVRLGVRTRGCNGLSYTLNYADKQEKFEDRVDSKGVTVLIEPKALMHIIGTTMDYYEDDLAAEFRFENPNAVGHCGCGESFNSSVPKTS